MDGLGFQQHTSSKACILAGKYWNLHHNLVGSTWTMNFESVSSFVHRHSSVREIALMMLMAYLSYMLAEPIHQAIAIDLCWSKKTREGVKKVSFMSTYQRRPCVVDLRLVFATMSFIAEAFIFLYVGMDALDIEKWKMSKLRFGTSLGIYSTLMLLILLGRAAFVFPLSAFSNYMNRNAGRSSTITFRHQIIIWWAGLMRGAVSIALAFKQFTYSGVTLDPLNATMVTITIVIVLFSTIVFGFLTKPIINCLLPHHAHNSNLNREPKSPVDDLTLPLISWEESAATNIARAKGSFSMLIERPVYTIHHYWRKFDDYYMRPIFGGPSSDNS
ncbi:Sodium/hydrogen exchanger 4 [Sarracenia purpurea var. burkii]